MLSIMFDVLGIVADVIIIVIAVKYLRNTKND